MADEKISSKVWTCTECGGHYLMLPVIAHEEYSIDDKEGIEFWGEISDEEPEYVFEEKEGITTAFCKTCQKETKCELREFKPDTAGKDPNLLKDMEKEIDKTVKNTKPLDSEFEV